MKFQREVDDIYRLKVPFMSVYTSVFLVKTDKRMILIDCATTDADVEKCIVPALQEMGLTLFDIQYLCLSHCHSDHAGGKDKILQLNPNIQIISETQCFLEEDIEICEMKGHTLDCIGLLDLRTGTLISCDGLQGAGIGKFRCSLESKDEYLKTLQSIRKDERIKNILFSHAYEPWYTDGAFGREAVNKCVLDCLNYI